MVDRCGQLCEEAVEAIEVSGIEGRTALRTELGRRAFQPVGIASGEDDLGSLGARLPGCLESDAGTASDHDDGLSQQLLTAGHGVAAAIAPRRAFSPAT